MFSVTDGMLPPRSNREQYRRADVEKMEKGVVKRRNKQRGLRRKKQENKGGEGEIMSCSSAGRQGAPSQQHS